MSAIWYIGIITTLTIVAAFSAMIGIGGGVLYTPLQILYGIDIHSAAANSLFLIIMLSISATVTYHRARKIDWRLASILSLCAVTGGIAGGYLSRFIPARPLTIVLIIVLALVGVIMLNHEPRNHAHIKVHRAWHLMTCATAGQRYTVNMLIAGPISILAGALSGLIGIGGGVLQVPLLFILCGVPMDIAVATSIFVAGITAAGGFTGHLAAGHWQWKVSLSMLPAIVVGAQIGSHVMLRVRKNVLRHIFGGFLLLIAGAVLARLVT